MEYKICENCEAKLHIRTLRCPNCNTLLTEASKIVNETPEIINTENNTEPNLGNNFDIEISDQEAHTNKIIEENPKDYVYKAEVRHSLEYTQPLSNFLKVILTAFSMIPIMGQFIGVFFGIFFSTYDDNDRSSFGKALIFLSILMFVFYAYNLMIVSQILETGDISSYLNNLVK